MDKLISASIENAHIVTKDELSLANKRCDLLGKENDSLHKRIEEITKKKNDATNQLFSVIKKAKQSTFKTRVKLLCKYLSS